MAMMPAGGRVRVLLDTSAQAVKKM